MKLFALHLPNGRMILGAGLYGRTLVLWIGTRPLCATFPNPTPAAVAFAHRGPECRW